MTIASRTPEGESGRCPACGHRFLLEPSRPPGDAPCPACGSLVWFPAADSLSSPAAELGSAPSFRVADRVRLREGMFAAAEGRVEAVDAGRGQVTVTLSIWEREVSVELPARAFVSVE
jgi:hypothetical protein